MLKKILNFIFNFYKKTNLKNSTIKVEEQTIENSLTTALPTETIKEEIDFLYDLAIFEDSKNKSSKNQKEKSQNPLKPLIFDFYPHFLPDYQIGLLDEIQYFQITRKYLHLNSFCSPEKLKILNNIFKELQEINDCLEPLRQIGLTIYMDLSGGAVRDFILDNHCLIKDLDIMISFPEFHFNLEDIQNNFRSKVINLFSWEELSKVNWKFEDNENRLLVNLIQLCFLKKDRIKKTYHDTRKNKEHSETLEHHDGSNYTVTSIDHLSGIIKLNKSFEHGFEIDLLITDWETYQFLDSFDINLCKVAINLVGKNKTFPQRAEHFISRIYAPVDFFIDVLHKTLTINLDNQNHVQIERSITNHLPRVLKKYPQYTPRFVGEESDRQFAQATYLSLKLEQELTGEIVEKKKSKL